MAADLRERIRDYLYAGLRDLRTREKLQDGAPEGWHDGYLEGSRRLAHDLCRLLDITWDDQTDAPLPLHWLPADVALTELKPGQAYLVTLPADAALEQLKQVRDDLARWARSLDDPPTFLVRRADIEVEPILSLQMCPRCQAELQAQYEGEG